MTTDGATEDIGDVLQQADWLSDLPRPLREQLAGDCERLALRRGDVVYVSGDVADRCWVLLDGRVGAGRPRHGTDDDESYWYFITDTPATTLCIENVITDIPYFATMRVLSDDASLLVVSSDALDRLLREHPPTGLAIARHVARRLQAFTEEAVDFALLDTNRRLAKYLLRLAGTDDVTAAMTQRDLAARLAASRQSINAGLAHLIRRGWIAQHGPTRYRVLDRDRLGRFAGGTPEPGAEAFR